MNGSDSRLVLFSSLKKNSSFVSISSRKRIASSPYKVGIAFIAVAIYILSFTLFLQRYSLFPNHQTKAINFHFV